MPVRLLVLALLVTASVPAFAQSTTLTGGTSSAVFPVACSACEQARVALAGAAASDWEKVLTNSDLRRLAETLNTRARAMAEAQKGNARDFSDVRAAIESPSLKLTPASLAGDWQCRTIKLGGQPPLAVYAYFNCTITVSATGIHIEKLTGSQRFSGALYAASDSELVFAGTGQTDYQPAVAYGTGPERDSVGILRSIGSGHLVLELPDPYLESKHDLIEFRRAASGQ